MRLALSTNSIIQTTTRDSVSSQCWRSIYRRNGRMGQASTEQFITEGPRKPSRAPSNFPKRPCRFPFSFQAESGFEMVLMVFEMVDTSILRAYIARKLVGFRIFFVE